MNSYGVQLPSHVVHSFDTFNYDLVIIGAGFDGYNAALHVVYKVILNIELMAEIRLWVQFFYFHIWVEVFFFSQIFFNIWAQKSFKLKYFVPIFFLIYGHKFEVIFHEI